MFPPRLFVLFAEDACRGILFFIDSYSAGGTEKMSFPLLGLWMSMTTFARCI